MNLSLNFVKRGLMGGRGSGGHNSKGKLRDVQCARLDVHELAREGKLKLGSHGWLFGTLWFEVTGGPDAQHLVLQFPWKSASGEQLDPIPQDILCYWRKAHYGERYLMFSCSECHRSARVLYAGYHHDRIWFFRCRKCAGITYQSTMGHRWDRSEVARSAKMGKERHYADQAARHAGENVPANLGDAGLPPGCAKAGGELRSTLQARSASCPFMAAMPK
jgi:hypothetical protein